MVDFSDEKVAKTLNFFTDTSGNLETGGFGCIFNQHWSWGVWSSDFMKKFKPSIEYLELAALTFGIFMWGEKIGNQRSIIFCDNEAVVHMINNFTSSCKNCMFLLRKIMLKCLENNSRIFARHVKTQDNGIADALSRQDWKRFRMLTKEMVIDKQATKPPTELFPLSKIWIE